MIVYLYTCVCAVLKVYIWCVWCVTNNTSLERAFNLPVTQDSRPFGQVQKKVDVRDYRLPVRQPDCPVFQFGRAVGVFDGSIRQQHRAGRQLQVYNSIS